MDSLGKLLVGCTIRYLAARDSVRLKVYNNSNKQFRIALKALQFQERAKLLPQAEVRRGIFSGERVWKLTGQVQQMQIGGGGVVDVVDLNNKTLYASPYLVYNEQGYSKHYYAGAERVSSRIGGGMQNALVDPLNSALSHLSDHDNYNAIASDLYEMLMRAAECAGMTRKYVSMAHVFGIIYETTGWSSPEPNWYIYHSATTSAPRPS
jgi:hypothetical protein